MEYPFDALHAGIESQILNLPAGIPDSQAIRHHYIFRLQDIYF